MGWTSEVNLRVRAPLSVTHYVRQCFTHKGFQCFSRDRCGGSYSRAYAKFSAFALDDVTLRLPELENLLDECLGKHGIDAGVTSQIFSFLAADALGELIYTFSIWKDNIDDVSQHLLDVLNDGLEQEYGSEWRTITFFKDELFVLAFSELGHGDLHCGDLTPSLLDNNGRVKEWFMYEESESDIQTRLQQTSKRGVDVDEERFVEFTDELREAHRECQPDAFYVRQLVWLSGSQTHPHLSGQRAQILGPVDLKTRFWPVKILETGELFDVGRRLIRRNLNNADSDSESDDDEDWEDEDEDMGGWGHQSTPVERICQGPQKEKKEEDWEDGQNWEDWQDDWQDDWQRWEDWEDWQIGKMKKKSKKKKKEKNEKKNKKSKRKAGHLQPHIAPKKQMPGTLEECSQSHRKTPSWPKMVNVVTRRL